MYCSLLRNVADLVKLPSRNERDKRWIWNTCPLIVSPKEEAVEEEALSESKLVRDLWWIILQVTQIKFSILPIFYFKQEINKVESLCGVGRSITR